MWDRIKKHTGLLYQAFVPLTGSQFNQVELAPFLTQAFQSGSLTAFFNAAFKSAIALGAIFAVLRIAYAGFMYMTTDIWDKKGQAKTILQQTIMGLLILTAIYLILNQINPDLLDLNILKVPQQNAAAPTGGTGN
jgi:hypothetical protein